jgi:hypothetical protein
MNLFTNITELNQYLNFASRIASMKQDSDFMPHFTSYLIPKVGDISKSYMSYYQEPNIKIEALQIDLEQIKEDYLTYFDFLNESDNKIGCKTGAQILEEIISEGREFVELSEGSKWFKLKSSNTLSLSNFGNVYMTQLDKFYCIVDIGFSD